MEWFVGWIKRPIWRYDDGEGQRDVNGQLATRVQGEAWAWAMSKSLNLICDIVQSLGPVLMSVAPVLNGGYAGAYVLRFPLEPCLHPSSMLPQVPHQSGCHAQPPRDMLTIWPWLLSRSMSRSMALLQPESEFLALAHIITRVYIRTQGLGHNL